MTEYLEQKLLDGQPVREARRRRRRPARAHGLRAGPRGAARTSSSASAVSTAAIPASVAFCHEVGLDYVSCSPYRVPIARLAAAHAALDARRTGHHGVTVATVRLPDGRALAFQEFGDPAGFPVLNRHGGLMCRLDVEPAAATAAELGLRIVSPDRPGVGRSDRRPGRVDGRLGGRCRAPARRARRSCVPRPPPPPTFDPDDLVRTGGVVAPGR